MENWRKFIKEDTRAFHGFKMDPSKMRVPGCDQGKPTPEDPDNQWTTGEKGCPKFSDDTNISDQHEDIVEALIFLENVRPKALIAYSRGGAVASAALNKSNYKPEVKFVAPAWNRGWVSGNPLPPSGLNGTIVHGTRDNAVPLKHSFFLAERTGMPLYVVPGANHINILKSKDDPQENGLRVSDEQITLGLKNLPEWKKGLGSDEQVESQHQFIEKLRK